MKPLELYQKLFDLYGPQHWWPLLNCKTGECEYKKRNYPLKPHQRFEVAAGAILTQNTQFDPNVVRALRSLLGILRSPITPEGVLDLKKEELSAAIKPAGYFNQKAQYLRNLAGYFLELGRKIPERASLLSLRGVGPETADSILLYAFNQPSFVIDAYTRRILEGLELVPLSQNYDQLRGWFMQSLEPDPALYNEFHALLVEHAKRYYSLKPWGVEDTLA